ncbi:MAG: hypothetical protein OER95_15180 [Acidimicrobiia bacterium]|nr:hypothetical protein [Acidimicrobiia bacterium]
MGGLVDDLDYAGPSRPLTQESDHLPTPIGDAPTAGAEGVSSLRQGSLWVMVVLAVVSLSGLLFWVIAAARFSDGDVGRAAAWYTLVQLAVIGAAFGGPIVINRSTGSPDAGRSSGATMVTVVALAGLAGIVAPFMAGSQWRTVGSLGRPLLSLVMVGLVVGSALVLLVDARLISLRRWRWLLVRAVIPSVVRVLLLLLDPWADNAGWILLAAAGPIALSGFVALAALIVRGEVTPTLPNWFGALERRFFAVQHLGAVATQLPYHLIPFLVARTVDPATNAAFYFVWAVGVMVSMIPLVLNQVLLSESSLARTGRETLIRTTLAANLGLIGLAWLISLVVAQPILDRFGPGYGELAPVLPFLLLASLAWGLGSVCLTETRLAHDNVGTALITATISVGSLLLALILMPGRPVWGATVAWLIANLTAVAVGMVVVERRVR